MKKTWIPIEPHNKVKIYYNPIIIMPDVSPIKKLWAGYGEERKAATHIIKENAAKEYTTIQGEYTTIQSKTENQQNN